MNEPRIKRRTPSAPARMSLIEQDLRSHARSLTDIVHSHSQMHERIVELEKSEQATMLREARKEERDVAMKLWQNRVDDQLQSIRGVGTKLLWIVGTAVVGAFMAFVIRGGLMP